ncbi:MAG: hypothetical protein ABUR63_01180 [Verrucomicrobiota bacterium]
MAREAAAWAQKADKAVPRPAGEAEGRLDPAAPPELVARRESAA